jgi:ActR/RegA family two-component response regulator
MEKYKAIVIDDQDQCLDMLVKPLRRLDFNVAGYDEAEAVLAEVLDVVRPLEEQPDLIVVDLKLKDGKMQGLDLIKLLISRDIPSVIVAMTGILESNEAEDAMKMGAAVVGKRLDSFLVDNFLVTMQKMERLAEIGRTRRLYRMRTGTAPRQMDSKRLRRPVFLSYSSRDTCIANGLRNNLEMQGIDVWYAPTALHPGDLWTECINAAIDHCNVFVALNTEDFLLSSECIAEFTRFHRRLKRNPDLRLLVVPVRYGLSRDRRHEILQLFADYQYVDLFPSYLGGLNSLIDQIKNFLDSRISKPPVARSTESDRVA